MRERFAVFVFTVALLAFASTGFVSGAAAPAGAQPGDRLLLLGRASYKREEYAEALDFCRRALEADRRAGDVAGEAEALRALGAAQEALERYDDAVASFAAALRLDRRSGNRLNQAKDLGDMGTVELFLGHYARALDLEEQALAIDRALANRRGEAAILLNIGAVEQGLARYADALAAYRRVLAIRMAFHDRRDEAKAWGNIAGVDIFLGRYAEALAAEKQALALDVAIGDRAQQAGDLGNMGIVESDLGRDDESLVLARRALALHRALGDRLGESQDLGNIAGLYADFGRYDDALAARRQTLAIDRDIKYPLGEAIDLGSIGNIEESHGRYDEALAAYRNALAIDRRIHNPLGEAGDLRNIGSIEESLGAYAAAETDFRRALAIDRAIHDRPGESDDLNSLGIVAAASNRDDEALADERQALALDRQAGDPSAQSADLVGIANVQDDLKHYDDALAGHEQALGLDRALKNVSGEAVDLGNIAHVEDYLGRYSDALDAARQAIALDTQLDDPEGLWRALLAEADVLAHLDDRDEAIAAYTASLAHIEALRAGLTSKERGGFFAHKLFAYDRFIAYLLELDARYPGSGYDRKAFEILERRSAREVLEQVGQSAALHFNGIPQTIVAQETTAEGVADAARRRLAALSAKSAGATEIAAAEARVSAADSGLAALETTIRADYPAYYRLRHPQPLAVECAEPGCTTLETFQRSVLAQGEVLLVFDVLEKQSALWLIDNEHVQLVHLPGRAALDAAVERVHAHVAGMLAPGLSASKLERNAAADLPGFAADSYALYGMLFPEAASAALARAKSLIVVPSGPLYRLAFETLVSKDPAAGGAPHYLLADAPLSYVPSASLLAVVRGSYAHPNARRSAFLAFANPAFGSDDAGGSRGASGYAGLQLAAVRSAFRPASAPGPQALADTLFPALPGTRVEADAVRLSLGAAESSVVEGESATRRHLLDLNAQQQLKTYRYLLFATHAVLPSEIAGLTQPAIVLAHPERGDGLLTMADVFGLSLDADFVALSACNTGVGAGGGAGISGLTRAFLFAGTPAISVTLWEVDDAAAPRITPNFFSGMYADALSPAQALRAAKLAMLQSPQARFRHPYAWGPSVIFGDGGRR